MNPSRTPADVIVHVMGGRQLIVPLGNGEPTAVLDAIEDAARTGDARVNGSAVHQMHAIQIGRAHV